MYDSIYIKFKTRKTEMLKMTLEVSLKTRETKEGFGGAGNILC